MKTKTTSTLIDAYLKHRSTPATYASIIRNVSAKSDVKTDTIRRTISRMVQRGSIQSVTLSKRSKFAGKHGFVSVN